jgi:ketosteroid isomerase-like protein
VKILARFGLVVVLVLGACSSNGDSASKRALSKAADQVAINELEVIFHRASSNKDIDQMMELWAEDATFTIGGQTYVGKEQVRKFVLASGPFKPENHWVSSTPAYKIRISSDGDRGTLYFECDYIDVDNRQVQAAVGADVKVARTKGRWQFTNVVAAPATIG